MRTLNYKHTLLYGYQRLLVLPLMLALNQFPMCAQGQLHESNPTMIPFPLNRQPIPIRSVAVSPDGEYLATGSYDHIGRIFKLNSLKLNALNPNDRSLNTVAAPYVTLKGHHDNILNITFSQDGKLLATGSKDGTVRIWNALSGESVKIGRKPLIIDTQYKKSRKNTHNKTVYSVAFLKDGDRIATGGADGIARIWSLSTGKVLFTTEKPDKDNGQHSDHPIIAVAISPNDRLLVTGSLDHDHPLKIWDLTTEQAVTFDDPNCKETPNGIVTIVFSHDGTKFAIGSRRIDMPSDSTYFEQWANRPFLRVWDTATLKEIRRFQGHLSDINSIVFSKHDDWIVSSSDDGTVRTWDLASGTEKKAFEVSEKHVGSIALIGDAIIVTGSHDGTARLWNLVSKKEIKCNGHSLLELSE